MCFFRYETAEWEFLIEGLVIRMWGEIDLGEFTVRYVIVRNGLGIRIGGGENRVLVGVGTNRGSRAGCRG